MRKKKYFFDKIQIFLVLFIMLSIILVVQTCRQNDDMPLELSFNQEICKGEKVAFAEGSPLYFSWNGKTLYLMCRKTVEFETVDGVRERHGQVIRDFTFGHVSLPDQPGVVEEKEMLVARTGSDRTFFLQTKATVRGIDYCLYRIQDGVKTIVCTGCFSS